MLVKLTPSLLGNPLASSQTVGKADNADSRQAGLPKVIKSDTNAEFWKTKDQLGPILLTSSGLTLDLGLKKPLPACIEA